MNNDLYIKVRSSVTPIDPDTQNFINSTGISDADIIDQIDWLVKFYKINGIWNKYKAIYPMVGGSAFTHSFNLKNPAQYQLSFSGVWIHSATGAKPNGVNAYADTGLNISTEFTNFQADHNISFSSRTNAVVGNGWNIGVGDTSTGNPLYGLAIQRAGGSEVIYDDGNLSTRFSVIEPSIGSQYFYQGNVSVVEGRVIQKNEKIIAQTISPTTGIIPSANLWIGAMNPTFGSAVYMDNECSGCTIGDSLLMKERTISYLGIQTMNTNLNRGV